MTLSVFRAAQAATCAAACAAVCAVTLAAASAAHAQAPVPSLRLAFDGAWAQQPEAQAQAAEREAASARQAAAQAWTPAPAALAVAARTDRLHRQQGARELEAELAVPLWLPGERQRSLALAEAQGRALDSRLGAARLRVAATVREAWWQWQRARADAASAQAQLANTRQIAADVARRLRAGDLALADSHQAEGAVATAEAAWALAEAQQALTGHALQTLAAIGIGTSTGAGAGTGTSIQAWPAAYIGAEAEPAEAEAAAAHAELQALQDRAAVADNTAALAATQTRAHPELTVGTTRDRGARGEPWQQSLTVGLRLPFGAGPQHTARRAGARAEALALQAELALARARLAGEREAARLRTEAARRQQAAAERRAQLALATRGFFDKSFRLGQTDLPTRLRIEAEAAEAERQAQRARIDLAAAISAWRQALGLLPQ